MTPAAARECRAASCVCPSPSAIVSILQAAQAPAIHRCPISSTCRHQTPESGPTVVVPCRHETEKKHGEGAGNWGPLGAEQEE